MALAARNPKNLRGVINVSGGLQTPDCPKEDVLVNAFKDYGATSRVPTLWVYAKNDSLFGPNLVERMQSAYLDGGGDVKLVMYDKFGDDGHALFGDADRPPALADGDGRLPALPRSAGDQARAHRRTAEAAEARTSAMSPSSTSISPRRPPR